MVSDVQTDFADNKGRSYDFYVYIRRALWIFSPILIPWAIYSILKGNLITGIIIAALYLPVNLILIWISSRSWHCSEHVFTLIKNLEINLGYEKATQTDSDSIKQRLEVALDNKSNKWRQETGEEGKK